MEEFFTGTFGVSGETFHIIILPLLIFFARICDVSINTIRIIFVMSGRRMISTILGFFESLIWLLAIGQIFQHIDNVYSYIAYPAGFAAGIFVGMFIEEKLAYGKVVVRLLTNEDTAPLRNFLEARKWRYVMIDGTSSDGHQQIVFTVINREHIELLLAEFHEHSPNGFYTIESVKSAAETSLLAQKPTGRRTIGSWLESIKRK
jgi:uncharacterized protein YebE (UPF0316 family)